jgi:hypothetical protein
VNAAYRVRGTEWTELVIGDPLWPQAYYPTPYVYEISEGDILVGICTYHNDEDHVVKAGPRHQDEMCNIYFMFFTENSNNVTDMCVGHSNRSLEELIPDKAKIRPLITYAGNWTYPTIKEPAFSKKKSVKLRHF